MRAVTDAFASYREAHRLIWNGGIWPVLVVPVLLTVIYLPAMVFVGFLSGRALSDGLLHLLPWLEDGGKWASWLVQGLLLLGFGIFAFFSYRIVVMLFYLPCLDLIIERAEARLLGKESYDHKRWYQMLVRMGLFALVILTLSAGLMVLNLLASLIPVMGPLIAMGCILPVQLFLTGAGYLDPYFDRNGYRVRESLRILRSRFPTVVAFEAVGSAFLLIPVVGWFLGPTYSVVAGVGLAIRMEENDPKSPTLEP
jgi:uncharacterized protein involved in cysteine biosynthesis